MALTVQYLLVAGGGGGASVWTSGGGAGGLLMGETTLDQLTAYPIIIGAGGAIAQRGGNSYFSTLIAIGGGNGDAGVGGLSGGSGGGGGTVPGQVTGGTGVAGQGNNGGDGVASGTNPGPGGGGGAGAVGGAGALGQAGAGGDGLQSSITGTLTYYAGGGGGGGYLPTAPGAGGLGGGGAGGGGAAGNGAAGTANTGGGGGGGAAFGVGGVGGSGYCVVSYVGAPQFTGGTLDTTTLPGITIHKFSSSAVLIPLATGAGGGGAALAGSTGTNTAGGAGGVGNVSGITGANVVYGSGGGGAGATVGGSAGSGAGAGGAGQQAGFAATTPGSGGGGGGVGYAGGNAQPGIVVMSYTSPQKYTGGTVTTAAGNTIHTFTSTSTLYPYITANYLLVAGGGGTQTGLTSAGGAGAGGVLANTTLISQSTSTTVTVGAGGTAYNNGGNTSFNGNVAIGGGRGTGSGSATGGSGSGGAGDGSIGSAGTAGQGFAGAAGAFVTNAVSCGGGGGGASANGTNAVAATSGGAGGAGIVSNITGANVTYAGGGGGGVGTAGTPGAGGAGGGGAGGSQTQFATVGIPFTGGGAGGEPYPGNFGGVTGGSGVAIISYSANTPAFGGGIVSVNGTNIVHTFTSTANLTPGNTIAATVLLVAGGGGGGVDVGGGGGAGGLITATTYLGNSNGQSYSVVVGSGGAAQTNGSNSTFNGITAIGGGAGTYATYPGNFGGSAGGAGYTVTYSTAGLSGQGTAGGAGSGGGVGAGAGGGGGSGTAGGNGVFNSVGGAGGNGTSSLISGSAVTYAGGGGAGSYQYTPGAGGTGGGGAGSASNGGVGGNATGYGSGGGGGGWGVGVGGSGSSGIVIISYSGTQQFFGGVVTSSGGNTIHTFTGSGTLEYRDTTVQYLLVGGGGAGGRTGGGAAGGFLTGVTRLSSTGSYPVTVGAGGASPVSTTVYGGSGTNTSISGFNAYGGGAGGSTSDAGPGQSGGSGGGGGANNVPGGAGTTGQGNAGGAGVTNGTTYNVGGGGGGASAAGANGTGAGAGAGGNGTASSITGASVTYAGGGGGGNDQNTLPQANGGTGGGGNGSRPNNGTTTAGTNGLGGGGGGGNGNGGSSPSYGGAGGSGVAVVSYAGSQIWTGGAISSAGGNTIHQFTTSSTLTPASSTGYAINNSLRFRAANSAYLTRTPPAASNRKTYTLSTWIKLGSNASSRIFSAEPGFAGAENATLSFGSNGSVSYQYYIPGVLNLYWASTAIFGDSSAWYHVVWAIDTTQASTTNAVKAYVNGVQQTLTYSASLGSYTQNMDTTINNSVDHIIGALNGFTQKFDGYMAEMNFIDGQALTPSSFGYTDTYGVWQPSQYTGTYGTNGFYLKFTDTNMPTLCSDSSGNHNDWSPSGISLLSGPTYDGMTDSPTNTSATVGNYCVLNPLGMIGTTLSNAGLTAALVGTAGGAVVIGTMELPVRTKIYAEVYISSVGDGTALGITNAPSTPANVLNGIISYSYSGGKTILGTNSAYGASYTAGDVIGIAVDTSAGTVEFFKNNVSQGVITNGAISSTTMFFTHLYYSSLLSAGSSWNFGQQPFKYTPPSGYLRLNTFNLPTVSIPNGRTVFTPTLYTGTGAVQNITNTGFYPDLTWMKRRSTVGSHVLCDSVRGATKLIYSNLTDAENVNTNSLTAFNSNGYTVGSDANCNQAGASLVAWQWNAGSGTVTTNTSGSTPSQVSVNPDAGFSIVSFTGVGSGTIGHGLGTTPAMMIIKNRGTASNWTVYHQGITSTPANYYINLNGGTAAINSAGIWNGLSPTVLPDITSAGNNYVAYCWSAVPGFSAFGSYTGNASASGPFIYTGFRPAYVLIKNTTDVGPFYWEVYDTARSTSNPETVVLYPNAADSEGSYASPQGVYGLANGFQIRETGGGTNNNGSNYIYMAFAENPFKTARAR